MGTRSSRPTLACRDIEDGVLPLGRRRPGLSVWMEGEVGRLEGGDEIRERTGILDDDEEEAIIWRREAAEDGEGCCNVESRDLCRDRAEVVR